MKFRVKATNETLQIAPDSLICGLRPDGNEVEFSVNDVELISNDWSSFRREAAKDILTRILSNSVEMFVDDKPVKTIEDYINLSIKLTDELIKRLKEK